MKLAVVLVCAMVILGGGSHRIHRCHGIYGIARVCDAHASISPQAFGVHWAHQYNQAADRLHRPWRIIAIGCRNDGEAVHICSATMRNIHTLATYCIGLAIGSSGQVLGVTHQRCGATA